MAASTLDRAPGTDSGADAGAALALPGGFVADLVAPLMADTRRARLAADLIGAPLTLACAAQCPDAEIDRESLRAAAQVQAVRAKPIRRRLAGLCAALANGGAPPVAFKGLASAVTLYPRPYLRLVPDADLLFRAEGLPRLTEMLRLWGFASVAAPATVRRWGALTEASFAPLAPPDRAFLIDVHRLVDDPPASRGLTTATIFDRAITVASDGGALRVAAPEHAFSILALHAFRDFYEPRGLKSLFDAALLLARHGPDLDWDAVERAARAGRFMRRMRFYRALLAEIGLGPLCPVFNERPPSPHLRRLAAGVAANFRHLTRFRQPDRRKLLFEATLHDSIAETLRWNGARLRGLLRPPSHHLPGLPRV